MERDRYERHLGGNLSSLGIGKICVRCQSTSHPVPLFSLFFSLPRLGDLCNQGLLFAHLGIAEVLSMPSV